MKVPIEDRFWSKVDKDSDSGCWEWQGARDPRRYGRFSVGGRNGGMKLAHRFSWELCNGPLIAGLLVRHVCDNPPCVNPDHLVSGTQLENMRDMARRGRSGVRRLSDPEVVEIRTRHQWGETQRALAEEFGTSQSNVGFIVRRATRVYADDLVALVTGDRP